MDYKQKKELEMTAEELFNKYAASTLTGVDKKLMNLKMFTQALGEVISLPVELPVSQENGGRECPICGGKNSKAYGGNDRCFHCETCGFVQCATTPKDLIYMLKKRINKFYKDSRFSG